MNHSARIPSRSGREHAQPLYPTEVWECTNEDCPCWMRKGLTFEEQPKCPMCGSEMMPGERMLPRVSDKEPR
ncbi:cold-inducible protein YdjO-related protein [Thermobacillus sp. ZCTH02-B1]|uniref:cold-inducible protein YdjO-related protein n=1 Tax=Thermobacillus sp. ZCTH02-B1 TaxID=1858795 RepID=UPI0025FF83AA|nr:cold-inducible protein YdjO-related protein [Thermobacillus sp. ZCTH02-B1]